jgi:hypothetical protein
MKDLCSLRLLPNLPLEIVHLSAITNFSMKQRIVDCFLFALLLFAAISCKKEMSFERAAGTLKDSLELCRPVEVSGTYSKGKSLSRADFFVTVDVNVTKTGVYKIQTNQNNGFMFAGSGIFKQKGLHKVQLKASGTPLADITTIFECFFDTSYCAFEIDVNDQSPAVPPVTADTLAINTWRFRDSTDNSFHHGIIDPLSTWFKTGPNGNYLNIMGWPSVSTGFTYDTLFNVAMYLPNPSIDTGTYSISSGVGSDHTFLYYYHSTKYTTPDFIFRILSYDSQQKTMKGSFDGNSEKRKDYSNSAITQHKIHGMFYLQLQ